MTRHVDHPTLEDIDMYMRRAREERAAAFAAVGRWLWRSITGRVRLSGPAPLVRA
jgi:hypothetical protein